MRMISVCLSTPGASWKIFYLISNSHMAKTTLLCHTHHTGIIIERWKGKKKTEREKNVS